MSSFQLKLLGIPTLLAAVLGYGIALQACHSHTFNRFGALITAYSAGLVIWQIWMEIRLENARRHFEQARSNDPVQASPVIESLRRRLVARQELKDEHRYISARMGVVLFVAANAIVGELIHGFGDLLVPSTAACAH